jgi:hypothetical protein
MSVGHLAVVEGSRARLHGERGQTGVSALPRTVANPKQGVWRNTRILSTILVPPSRVFAELGGSFTHAEGQGRGRDDSAQSHVGRRIHTRPRAEAHERIGNTGASRNSRGLTGAENLKREPKPQAVSRRLGSRPGLPASFIPRSRGTCVRGRPSRFVYQAASRSRPAWQVRYLRRSPHYPAWVKRHETADPSKPKILEVDAR